MAKMIGIVGGIGTYAGIDLQQKIYQHTNAGKDQDHFAVNMISTPAEVLDRTEYLVGIVKENPGIAIGKIAAKLADNGAEVIGLPCNTAHAPKIYNEIVSRAPASCQVLHMIKEVGEFIHQEYPDIKKVGILCTNGTNKANIYPEYLDPIGIDAFHPDEDIQKQVVHPAIYDPSYGIKAQSSPVTKKAMVDLEAAADHLMQQGAEALVLGCTEIPLALTEDHYQGLPLIDATAVLALALIREANK